MPFLTAAPGVRVSGNFRHIGTVAVRYQNLLRSIFTMVDRALGNMRHNGQSAQAVATQIAGILAGIARQIS